jgi:hypothetical protein
MPDVPARPRRPFQTRQDPVHAEPKLPHERDETAANETDGVRGPREDIAQAARDIERGLVDTEARGTPSNVPSPHRQSTRRGGKPRKR